MPVISSGEQLTKLNEGCVLEAKPDAKGHWEIGWGHDLEPSPSLVWTQQQCDDQFDIDYPLARTRAVSDLGIQAWAALDPPRQAVLADVAYEIGGAGLAEFRIMLSAVRRSDWHGAAVALQNSELFSQVPTREARNVKIMLTGEWPNG